MYVGTLSIYLAGVKKPAPAGKPVEQKPKEKVWTKEDDMARKIQTKYRQYRAKKLLEKKKQEKQEYDDLMDKLEKEVLTVYIIWARFARKLDFVACKQQRHIPTFVPDLGQSNQCLVICSLKSVKA